MDRREVHDVEAHGRDVRQAIDAVLEGPVPAGAALGTGEELVPRGALRQGAVDDHFQLTVVRRCRAPIRVAFHQLGGVVRQQEPRALERRRRAFERREACLDALLVRPHRPLEGGPQQRRPLLQLARHVHARRESLLEIRRPAPVGIRVRLDRVQVPRVLFEDEPALPSIVVDVAHGHFAPGGVLHRAVLEHRRQRLVPLTQDVGGHVEHVADHTLHGMTSAGKLRPHAGDPHRPDVASHNVHRSAMGCLGTADGASTARTN
jgi:hypothetical protein